MSHYTVYVTPDALREIKVLPGNMRQRVKRTVEKLADEPHPPGSKILDVPSVEPEVCYLKLDKWRIVYAISKTEDSIDVLAVQKRPPYDYGDLARLLTDIF